MQQKLFRQSYKVKIFNYSYLWTQGVPGKRWPTASYAWLKYNSRIIM